MIVPIEFEKLLQNAHYVESHYYSFKSGLMVPAKSALTIHANLHTVYSMVRGSNKYVPKARLNQSYAESDFWAGLRGIRAKRPLFIQLIIFTHERIITLVHRSVSDLRQTIYYDFYYTNLNYRKHSHELIGIVEPPPKEFDTLRHTHIKLVDHGRVVFWR